MEKKCSECEQVKPLEMFYKYPRGFLGRQSICKPCQYAKYQNTQKRKNYKLDWLKANKQKANEASKRWREAHKDKMRQIKDSWNERNQDKVAAMKAAYKHRYRAKVKENGNNDLTRDQIEHLFKTQEYCSYCGKVAKLTIDHIIPVSKGGQNTITNITLACGPCNSVKGNKVGRFSQTS